MALTGLYRIRDADFRIVEFPAKACYFDIHRSARFMGGEHLRNQRRIGRRPAGDSEVEVGCRRRWQAEAEAAEAPYNAPPSLNAHVRFRLRDMEHGYSQIQRGNGHPKHFHQQERSPYGTSPR